MRICTEGILARPVRYLILIILCVGLVLPLVFYIYHFSHSFSKEHIRWSEFGSYIGGVYGALGFFAVAISIYFTNRQFRCQFESDLIYKGVNTLSNLLNDDGKSVHNKESILSLSEEFVINFKRSLGEQSARRARNILCKYPVLLNDISRFKLRTILQDKLPKNITMDQFLSDLKSSAYEDCWECLKYYFGNPDDESECNRFLADIGMILFYRIPFESRLVYYQKAWEDSTAERGLSIDRFFNMLFFSLSHAYQSVDRELYFKFISAHFCAHDYVFIFYGSLILVQKEPELVKYLLKAGFLDNIKRQEILSIMYDSPSQEDLELEFRYLLDSLSSTAIPTWAERR